MKITEKLPRGLVIGSFIAIFFVLALLPFIAWLLEYKDTISAPLTITTEVTPVDIYARSTGELKLLVTNNALVEKDAPLAVIRNTATYEDMQLLKNKLALNSNTPIAMAKDLCLLQDAEIGELKPALVRVHTTFEAYQNFIATDRHQALIVSREKQIAQYVVRKDLMNQKSEKLAEDQVYEEALIQTQKELLEAGATSNQDYQIAKRKTIVQDLAKLETITEANALDLNIETLEREKLELASQFDFDRLNLINEIKQALRLLETGLSAWELKYLLKANVAGHCIFKEHFNDYRFARQGEKIFSLIPKEDSPYFALLQLPIQGAGKVRDTQDVYVKLSNYPFMEYGVLKGKINAISALPFEDHYNVQVNFPSDLITTYGDTIEPQALMHGIGEVIIERKSLYNRIAEQIKSARLNR